ncbi:MAG: o-succinylbenzoate synthase [Gemmatimonadota bacterium]|nr:o-succinylbenzoate synthase [Gemmatimonadota bacterium]
MSFAIRTISLREIELSLKEPFTISSGTVDTRKILLVHLSTHDDIDVWAECVAGEKPNYSPETLDTARIAIEEWIAPRLLGKDIDHPDQVHGILNENFRGHNMAKAAIEMGSWAIGAVMANKSLANFLGGTRKKIATGISIGIQPNPEALVEKAQAALAEGYNKVKIKIRPGRDVDFVQAVRDAVGPKAQLMADANNAYTEDDFDTIKKLDPLGLTMIEQPLAWDDVVRHASLQRIMDTPICLDESITGVDKAEDMINLKSGRIINIKPGRVGGFTQSKAIHDLCEKNDMPVWCGGMLESGIGRAYNVALASLPNFKLPGDVSPSARYWEEDIVDPEWTMDEEGMVEVPLTDPGLGVEIRTDRIDSLTTKEISIGA